MSDIAIVWNNELGQGDWGFSNGDLTSGGDIETSVLISLFTDRRAPSEFIPTDGTNDRRGWWGDTFEPSPIGSGLWQLTRAKKTNQTTLLLEVRDMCNAALQWMLDEEIVAAIKVNAFWLTADAIGITVNVTEPAQTSSTTFSYSWAYGSVTSLPSPVPIILS